MRRRALIPAVVLVLLAGAVLSAPPAGASRARDVNPAQLAVPPSALPTGTAVDESLVSTNADADGTTNPIRQLHGKNYADMGRLTGYREKFHFPLGGGSVTVTYVASLFSTGDQAHAALNDATGPGSIIGLIGRAVSPACTAGEICRAYSGANGSSAIEYTAFVRGRVLVEVASASDGSTFSSDAASITTTLYGIDASVDTVVQNALAGSGSSTPNSTPVATATPTATATSVNQPAPVVALNPPLRQYYVAIGDSYSLGYLAPGQPAPDPQCQSADAPGFVCVFYRYLKAIKSSLQVQNFSEGGADSCELAGAGHRCYNTSHLNNPLDTATQFLSAHPGQVSPITVTIGGNDLLALASQAVQDPSSVISRVPTILTSYRANLDTILARVRGAAPDAEIIVTTQPNPFGGLGSPPLPAILATASPAVLGQLNAIMKQEAPKYKAVIADSAAAWDAYPGGGSQLSWVPVYLPQGSVEIHPTPKGYQVYGDAVIAASGYLSSLAVKAKLGKKTVSPRSTQKVSGTTNPAVTVTIQIHNPRTSAQTVKLTAGDTGTYSRSFKAGKARGAGWVKVCAADAAGRSTCSAKLSFTVR